MVGKEDCFCSSGSALALCLYEVLVTTVSEWLPSPTILHIMDRLEESEALGKEEPDREKGLWQPGLPAAEYPEDLEGPDCSPGQRESDTEGEREWPAAEYLDEMEGPELPAAECQDKMEGPERPT
ncbi:hypothetical protein UY3_05998 [Chelonia mydas]|uniref:Uncharacterized protein n=1 Tax=Chelonia mydas TaxID=8469 RepID=M7C8E3_CHEMY|nr:hypothetical protein UY3_05998 [Chelonia mydas]